MKHASPGGALKRSIDPEGAGWDVNSYLLAEAIDRLEGANWQRANAGAKTPKPAPDRFPRPHEPAKRRGRGRNLVPQHILDARKAGH